LAKIDQRKFQLVVENEIAKKISRATIRKAAQAAGNKAIEMIRERTNAGIDYYGKRIPKLTENYELRKRGGRELANLIRRSGKATKFKANGTPNHGRLTGQFFSAMTFKILNTTIKAKQILIDILLDLKSDQVKKVKWLESKTGATRGWGGRGKKKTYSKAQRFIWGLAKSGAWFTKERKAIETAFRNSFVKNSGIKVK